MPVDPTWQYAEVSHEKTILKDGWRYACNNSVAKTFYYAPDRVYDLDGTYEVVLKKIETQWLDRKCQMHLRDVDVGCAGCLK